MGKEIITWQAVNQVLKDYGDRYKAYPIYAGIGFLLPALGNIGVFFIPPLVVARIIDILVARGSISTAELWVAFPLFGGIWLLGEGCWRVGLHFILKLEERGLNALQTLSFSRLVERDYAFYTNNFVGSLTKKALAFARAFEVFTDTLVFNVVTNIVTILFVVVILWRYSFWIPLVLVLWIAAALCVAIPLIRRRSRLVALRHEANSKVAGRLSDAITNMLAIKAFAKEKTELASFGSTVDDFTRLYKRTGNYQNLRIDTVLSPIYVATNICGLLLAIFYSQAFALQPGAVVVIFSYYSLVTRIIWEINRIYRNIESSISEAAEFTQLFITPPTIQDKPDATSLIVSKAMVRFNRITFKYNDTDEKEPAFLNDFILNINGHERVGLVGPSGGGKTTITKLLLRFIDLQSGSITIDGQDISTMTQASLRGAIAYVPQDPLLFHRSLAENIAYSNERATHADVVRAAKLAHADEFISVLPKGYDTLVGERGIKLSGGQRQRVAIARALLKQSEILVLDEATSSLDSESEKYIQEGLWELMKEKTALVIAHRLSTIKHLDRIVVLDQGKIVQEGTHDELINAKGLYAKLWSLQSGEFI
ncbi:ABC transporter ATP-binding protein [Candidatus Uhrbacteria bacterium]|nr:ABC transporter ATP-binding protein [Candidatus Uhrbacteria bacterium]